MEASTEGDHMPTKTHTTNHNSKAAPTLPSSAPNQCSSSEQWPDSPIGLDEKVRLQSVNNLNQVLADTMMLRDLYKKHHWQVTGIPSISCTCCSTSTTASRPRLVDAIAERIQLLGGVAIALAQTLPNTPESNARRFTAKRFRCSSHGCSKRTNSF